MNLTQKGLAIYFGCGVIFQLLMHGHLNPFRLSTWMNIILWLPLILFHFLWNIIFVFVLFGLAVWAIAYFRPEVKAAIRNKLKL